MSEAVATIGTILTRKVGAGSALPVAQIQDITGPQLSTDTDEITNHDSPGGVEEFIATIKRTGEVTFPLVFLGSDASHDGDTGLISGWSNKSLDLYVMTYPGEGGSWAFAAYVTGFSMSAPVTGHLSADVTLRPSGEPVFSPPA